ncbi:NAD(P)/FAD-dependent oxidoreductase [Rubrivirga sp.]|uniref:NAD(P)/FAD-dependent oxidoreductase n=1 Tax=Rubrivirga sp. TaxID=1885344 RepID=UPI003B522C43
MTEPADVVVAGAGLAGACAALVLSRTRRVVVLEPGRPAGGASGAAAGLANPFMGRAAKPAWRHDEALDALAELADETDDGLFRRTGVLRPAASGTQATTFRERAGAHTDLDWLDADASAERWPLVSAPHGALVVRRGGSVDLAAFVEAALAVATARGARLVRARLTGWETDPLIAITDLGPIPTRALVLTLGDGARGLSALTDLPLHRVKGQTVRLARPAVLPAGHHAVAGAGYVVPRAGDVVAGATFDHSFVDLAPDPVLDAGLASRAAALVPSLAGARVLGRAAGVRLTVPSVVSSRRLPLAGPLPGHPGVWVLTGLGAKGLVTAPLLARLLPDALDGVRPLPAETALAPTV